MAKALKAVGEQSPTQAIRGMENVTPKWFQDKAICLNTINSNRRKESSVCQTIVIAT